ncbi:hypothetical protein FRC09_006791 [Ceratobasidium sp. 395]|nr:hypothetical protein FRC09_006791 [Ceratobasidium sp. 395]
MSKSVHSLDDLPSYPCPDLKRFLTGFGHAASCFATAATTLSSAAQHLAIAADALSKASIQIESLNFGQPEFSSDSANDVRSESPAPRGLSRDPVPPVSRKVTLSEEAGLDDQHINNTFDPDCDDDYFAEEDEIYLQALIKRQREEKMVHETQCVSRSESPTTLNHAMPFILLSDKPVSPKLGATCNNISDIIRNVPPFQRSLLVSSESDILPIVCAFTQCRNKTLCYLTCPLPSMMLFQKIIKGVTGSMVYAVSRATPSEVANVCRASSRQTKAVLLLPDTAHYDATSEAEDDLFVVHMGWPCNDEQYVVVAQVKLPSASHSVLVACSENQDQYLACAKVLTHTSAWPDEDHSVFESEVISLRLKLDEVLADIPTDMKAKFYCDWIELHGPRGQRYVPSWSPMTLVACANLYMRDVLKYPVQKDSDLSCQGFPPKVSRAFVAANELEVAVEAGLLNVENEEPRLHPWFDRPKTETYTPNNKSRDSLSACAPSQLQSSPNSVELHAATTDIHNPTRLRGDPAANTSGATPMSAVIFQQPNDLHGPSKTCLVVDNEFEFIPAICYYARNPDVKNTVCYVKIVGIMQTLSTQIQALISRPVFVVATDMSEAIPRVLQAFESPTGCLVFCNTLIPLSKRLQTKAIHQVIHAGWISNRPYYEQQTNCAGLLRKQQILTQSDYTILSQKLPYLSASCVFSSNLLSEPYWTKTLESWKHQLRVAPKKALNGCYMEWMLYHATGPYKVSNWSIIDLVNQANQFAELVLLRGSADENGDKFVGDKLSVTEGFVRHMGLGLAVKTRILELGS